MIKEFDLIVIGAGSGGLAAAKRAAKYGANVAIIEGDKIGGTCVIRGCVPKKLMVYASKARKNILAADSYGLNTKKIELNSKFLFENIRNEVNRLSELHLNSLRNLNIEIFNGWGKFINESELEIICPNTEKFLTKLKGNKFLISVGGKPKKLRIPGSNFAWTSDDIFKLKNLPKSLLIVGGGYIACEFASIFSNFGVNVTQLVRRDNLLNGFDSDLSLALKESMISSGINLIFNDELISINKQGSSNYELSLKSGLELRKESILMATGREPNIDFLDIESLGIKKERGFIVVNQFNQTNKFNIFAIGDVIDKPNLTPVAIEQGRIFSDNYFGKLNREINYNYIPKAVFTTPEISTVGLSEKEAINLLTEENIEIFKCRFTPMSNTFKKLKSKCLLKLVVNKNNDKVLGVHMFGESSSEIIQMVSISLNLGVTKKQFDETMALHPTVSEEFVTMYK